MDKDTRSINEWGDPIPPRSFQFTSKEYLATSTCMFAIAIDLAKHGKRRSSMMMYNLACLVKKMSEGLDLHEVPF